MNKVSFMFLMFFGIIIVGFSFIGVIRFFNKDILSKELVFIRNKNVLLQNLLSDMELHGVLDSSKHYENFIVDYYDKYDLHLPNKKPVYGYVTRGLNEENNHFGIDIAAKHHDEIFSPGNGRVIFSGMSNDLGNIIIISHPAGFISLFAHNDTNIVNSGMLVEKGQLIGYVGETGNSKGPHLHFEMWKNSEILDPREIISDYKKKDVSIR